MGRRKKKELWRTTSIRTVLDSPEIPDIVGEAVLKPGSTPPFAMLGIMKNLSRLVNKTNFLPEMSLLEPIIHKKAYIQSARPDLN